jgi:hypothetical protein
MVLWAPQEEKVKAAHAAVPVIEKMEVEVLRSVPHWVEKKISQL